MTSVKLITQLLALIVIVTAAVDAVAQKSSGPERLRSLIGDSFSNQVTPATCSIPILRSKRIQNNSPKSHLKPSILVKKNNLPDRVDEAEALEGPVVIYEEISARRINSQRSQETSGLNTSRPAAPTLILPSPNNAMVDAGSPESVVMGFLEVSSGESITADFSAYDDPAIAGPEDTGPANPEPTNIEPTNSQHANVELICELPTDELSTHKLPEIRQPRIGGAQDPTQHESAIVVIRAPMRQPYKKNQYTFVVENEGSMDANDVKVGISVPDSGKIIAVLPENSVASDQTALVRFDELAAGEKAQIHLTAVSEVGIPISFATTVSSTSLQNFQVQHFTQPLPVQKAALRDPVPKRVTTPSSTNAEDSEHFGPVVLKNPFFDNEIVEPSWTRQTLPSPATSTASSPSTPLPIEIKPPITSSPVSYRTSIEDRENKTPIPTVGPQTIVAAIISGPKVLSLGHLAEYQIAVINQTGQSVSDVSVNLALPAGLDVFAMEQAGGYDAETRTLSWKIPVVQNGRTARLRYQVRSTGDANCTQTAVLRIRNRTMGHTKFETLTVNGPPVR